MNQKGGYDINKNNKKYIKNKLYVYVQDSDLSFNDVRKPKNHYSYNKRLNDEFQIIIVKQKNGINKSSTYYAIQMDNGSPTFFAIGIGKEDFYNKLKEIRDRANNNLNLKNSIPNKKNAIIATKILIYYKTNWYNYEPFSKEFYDLNKYFMSRID